MSATTAIISAKFPAHVAFLHVLARSARVVGWHSRLKPCFAPVVHVAEPRAIWLWLRREQHVEKRQE
jgi:hypothetical protein